MIIVYTYCTFQNTQLFLNHRGKGGKKEGNIPSDLLDRNNAT